jgi:hypothetical protein
MWGALLWGRQAISISASTHRDVMVEHSSFVGNINAPDGLDDGPFDRQFVDGGAIHKDGSGMLVVRHSLFVENAAAVRPPSAALATPGRGTGVVGGTRGGGVSGLSEARRGNRRGVARYTVEARATCSWSARPSSGTWRRCALLGSPSRAMPPLTRCGGVHICTMLPHPQALCWCLTLELGWAPDRWRNILCGQSRGEALVLRLERSGGTSALIEPAGQ